MNVAIAPVGPATGGYSRLGVIAGDTGGFPNGRRVSDDVTDVLERVVGGGILAAGTPPDGAQTSGHVQASAWTDVFPNNALNDGVDSNDVAFLDAFPYLGSPHPGL